MGATHKTILMHLNQYEINFLLKPFSFSIEHNSKEVLSSVPRNDLELKSFKKSKDEVTLNFLDSSGNELTLSLKLTSDTLFINWVSNFEVDFTEGYYISDFLYGAGFLVPQDFPFNSNFESTSFPSGNVQVPYVFTSSGLGILMLDYKPIHVSYSLDASSKKNILKFGRKDSSLQYRIILGNNVTDLYYKFISIVGKPRSAPSEVVFTKPIYSTWAQYKTAVDQEKVLQYAKDIIKYNFPLGIIEIDDKWEVHYGDFEFDNSKFPDPKSMVQELHNLGFLVTLWVYPFINLDSKNYQFAVSEKLLVRDKSGNPITVRWWNGEAGLLDFTNPKTYEWFKEKLLNLQKNYGFDGFKFDAGDAGFFPYGSVTFQPIFPAQYGDIYMKFIADNFHELSETRVSTFAQPLGLLTRLGDKDSRWGLNNGLHSVITSTLTYSLIGYPFILPDMIGGNEYGNERCNSELFIRWVEVSVPMPSIQFSILPWRPEFNEQVINISKEYAWLHVKLSKYILSLVNQSLKDGSPIVRPLFFNYDAEELFKVNDEFMLGESLLFAPVVKQGATSRDVVLPEGKWLDLWENKEYEGPTTIQNYEAPIYKLPIFINIEKPVDKETLAEVKKIISNLEEH